MTRGITYRYNGARHEVIVHTDIGDQTYDLSVMNREEQNAVRDLVKNWWLDKHFSAQGIAA